MNGAGNAAPVGTVTDDLGQREHEQGVEVPRLARDPHRATGIHSQAARVGPAAGDVTIAATAKMAGPNHSDTATRSRKSARHSGSGCTGSAFTL